MKLRTQLMTGICSSLLLAGSAHATIDALMEVKYGAEGLQRSGYCLLDRTMIANIGIPPASVMKGMTTDVMIFDEARADGIQQINHNVLSEIDVSYVSDEFVEDESTGKTTLVYEMIMDVSKLSLIASHDNRKVIELTKLAIIAANENMKDSRSSYKLHIEVLGLPHQDATTGSKVYSKTSHPYTATSPLLETYRTELENLGDGEKLEECN